MKLSMRNVILAADYGEIYRLFTDDNTNQLILNKYDHNSMDVFKKWLDEKLLHEFNDFMVFHNDDGEFIGFAYTYDFNPIDGHAVFSVAIKPQFQKIGCGGFVSVMFLKYLFLNYPLRKLYAHVYDYNVESIVCLERFGFINEGVLKEYKYACGKYRDLIFYTISKDDFWRNINYLGI